MWKRHKVHMNKFQHGFIVSSDDFFLILTPSNKIEKIVVVAE